MAMDNYRLLVEKLDQFIRKYYINQLIRGALYSIGLILVLFLAASILEYNFYFSTTVRKALVYTFIGISGLALFRWIFTPMLHYFRLGKLISHEQAAIIIGSHFTDVKDKLLNILQLRQQSDTTANKELILASINQKSEEIKPVPFKAAINLSQNRKYLRYALPPLLLLLILLLTAPSIIRDSTFRLLNSGKEFFRPAPFRFVVDERKLSVVQFGDFPLQVKIVGDQLPNEVFIEVDKVQYRLTKESSDLFTYQFNNVQKDLAFNLKAGLVDSKDFTLEVLKKPNILGFDVKLNYPAYIGRKNEEIASVGDLVVPAGTRIDWIFNAENTDNIRIQFAGGKLEDIKRFSDDLFTYKKQAFKDEPYKVFISNQVVPKGDSISYSITVIPDLYPNINAEKFQDSTDDKVLYFIGEATDDYGLRSLSFNYQIKKANGQKGNLQTIKLANPEGKQTRFDHIFDLRNLDLKPGDEVNYYFEIYDNDGVNGNKAARTNMMVFAMPTVEQYQAMAEKNSDQVKKDLKSAMEESRRIQEEMKRAREKLLQEKDLDWQSRKELEKLLERQKELQKKIEEAKKAFEENKKNQQEFSQQDQETLEKQEQLQKLFEETMSKEMQDLMKQIEDMLQKLEKDQALEMMENMQMNNQNVEKELDRLLELYKQLEVEQQTKEAIEALQKLAEEQEKLSEETKQTDEQKNKDQKSENQKGEDQKGEDQKNQNEKTGDKKSNEQKSNDQKSEEQKKKDQNQSGDQNQQEKPKQDQLKEKQEGINEKFDDIQKKMNELEKKNEALEKPKELGEHDQEMKDIKQDLNNSQQQLQQQQNKKASQSQKNAAQKMKNMANNMQMQMQEGQMQQMQEDMQALRQLLENLVGLSFDQEDLVKEFDKAAINTPRYVELVQNQNKIKDDFRLVEDSLQALSKRLFQIETFITDKVSDIKDNMRQSLDHLEERQKPQAEDNQQRTMKGLNDLALMLSEMMNQMQQQMASMMAGSQMCNNPKPGGQGQSGEPKDKISEGQKQVNEGMKKMKEQMDKAKQQGQGNGASAREFAEMAAKQAALRKALRDQQKKRQERGQGSKELQDIIDQMDKTETELVNKRLTNEMLKRQQDILSRLLEHEKAERERGYEEKRKAETATEKERKMPPSLEEYIKKREAEIEMYKTVSPTLKPYYKYLVEEYFKTLKSK